MRENERERLYYLFQESKCPMHFLDNKEILDTVDYLLENGVVVPPCKVGDAVYRIYTRAWIGEDVVREVVVSENGVFYIDDKGRMTSCNKFGKTVFLTREDAERVLKGGAE